MIPYAALAGQVGSSVTGLVGAFNSGVTGKKPKVPAFRPIDSTVEQGRAIAGNITNFEDARKLVEMTNNLNSEQLTTMLRKAIPGYDSIVAKASQNVSSLLSGEIPADVQAKINRTAAGRALAGGFGGSGLARNLEARDLGLTSLNLTTQGQASAERWLELGRRSLSPDFADVSSMFISPWQKILFEQSERDSQWNRDWLASQVKASPDPRKVAQVAAVKSAFDSFGSFGGGGR